MQTPSRNQPKFFSTEALRTRCNRPGTIKGSTSPDASKANRKLIVFKETQNAAPRNNPGASERRHVKLEPNSNHAAISSNTTQRQSARNSTEHVTKGGNNPRASAPHTPMRGPNKLRPSQ